MEKYKLIESKYLEEVAGECKVYEHIKTGAKVLTISNDDTNKSFGIAFRTTPENSKGTAHIVEHCVLQGSRKYRTKEPFMDMLKRSVQTFLNAMTYPDKTMYPIATRNVKDFYNLMDLYLDGVFHPSMYEEKKIFLQEGWHYELQDIEGELTRSGVVFNEMKGAYAQADSQIFDAVTFNLHPESTYGVDSGGDPMDIPKLSYEEFLAFHKRYYHPSNSYIYLYGNLDMEKALNFIDENYIDKYEKADPDSDVKLNPPFESMKRHTSYYSITKDEMGPMKDVLTYSVSVNEGDDPMTSFMLSFLSELLVTSEAAPVKLALQEAGIGEEISYFTNSSKPFDFTIIAKNTDKSYEDKFIEIIEGTLQKLVEEGIDKKFINATLNKFEFLAREGYGSQKAVIYFIIAMRTWLYDKSPIKALELNDIINKVRSEIDKGFVEKFIQKYLIDNPYKMSLTVLPKVDMSKENEEAQQKELNEYKKTLSEEELKEIIRSTEELKEYQHSESTEEQKKTLPNLEISDLTDEVTDLSMEIVDRGDYKILIKRENTNKIAYGILGFDVSHIGEDELKDLALVRLLLSSISTAKYSFEDIDMETYLRSGGYNFRLDAVKNLKTGKTDRRFFVSMKYLEGKGEEAFELLSEIMFNTIFTEKERIKNILLEEKSALTSYMMAAPNAYAKNILQSQIDEAGKFQNIVTGSEYYDHVVETIAAFDKDFDAIVERINAVYKKAFNKHNMLFHFTGEENLKDEYINCAEELFAKLKYESEEIKDIKVNPKKNIGYTFSSNVNFVTMMGEFEEEYKGKMEVLKNFLSLDYLYTMIRAVGGAYGMGISFTRDGASQIYSFRDPNLTKTLEVFKSLPEYIEGVNISEEDLKNYIIGSTNAFNPLLDPPSKGLVTLYSHIRGMDEETLKASKREALSTKAEDINLFKDLLTTIVKQNHYVVIGGEDINKNKDLFDEIKPLIK